MKLIRQALIKLVGYTLISIVAYILVCLKILFFSVVALELGHSFSYTPFQQVQKKIYGIGFRNVWQGIPTCVEPNDDLVYVPKLGVCKFSNFEFDTVLNFDSYGRIVPNRIYTKESQPGIAILGDSHAMGWGVNDDQTFANILQSGTNKPVFNLAVSSYATERELKRLLLSGLLKKVDTIIITYCDNDIYANMKDLTKSEHEEQVKDFKRSLLTDAHGAMNSGLRKTAFSELIKYSLVVIPESIVDFIYGPIQNPSLDKHFNFENHYVSLTEILKRYKSYIDDKKIIVIYINEHGRKFIGFPVGIDKNLKFVSYQEPELNKSHFFNVDDHLNAHGHEAIGLWLTSLLKLSDSHDSPIKK